MGDVRTNLWTAGRRVWPGIWPGFWAGLALNVFFQEAVSVIDTACDGFNPPA
jgi:hypothetical protein